MHFKESKKDELLNFLRKDSDVTFFHLVKIDLSAGFGKSEFRREESLFEDKCGIYKIWCQGLYHLPEDERSFIEIVYNEFITKYSLHVITELIPRENEPYINIEIEKRNIFIKIGLHELKNQIKVSLSAAPLKVGNLNQYIDSIVNDKLFQSSVYFPELREELSRNAEFIINKIQVYENETIELHLKNILGRLIKLLYPTSWEKRLQYSVFIIPGYVSDSNEQTSGGAVAFFDPKGFSKSFKEKVYAISNKTALWSNLETVESLLQLAEIQSIWTAIAQVLARNLSHNIGSHVLNIVSKYFLDSQDGEEDLPRAAFLFEFVQKRMEFIANGLRAPFQSTHRLFEEILPAYLNNNQKRKQKRQQLISLFDNISGNKQIDSTKIIFKNSCDDIFVSIPNGTLGFHALYTLLENIIRNSVKHNQKFPMELVYKIKIESPSPSEPQDFYKISITDNFGKINSETGLDVPLLNHNLSLSILENGSLRSNNWGLLEMKICATFLLGLPIEQIDSANNCICLEINGITQSFPPALIISQDQENNLVHTFHLQKPKTAALIGTSFIESKSIGIEHVTNKDTFQRTGSKHSFAVFEESNLTIDHEKKMNQRSVHYETIGSKKLSLNENMLWEKYSEKNNWNAYDLQIGSFEKNLTIDNGFRYIILDNHDEWAKEGDNWQKVLQNPNKILYYEYVSSQSITKSAVCEKIQNNKSSILKQKIFEMAFTDIIVLDERVQKNFGAEKLNHNICQNPKFANLFLPPIDENTDLDMANTDDIILWAKEIPQFRAGFKLNYLIIHRSLVGRHRINVETLKENLCPEITIFVSGGGTPPNLKEGEFYIPFDVLNNCLGSNPSKFALVNILKSLRQNVN
ncbi:MAG: hypothetical protein H6581_05375 [Bacteroidia bacterium]|nr:hypothetical protein [Bacteroidia bacterium]